MDTIRRVGTCGDDIKSIIVERGVRAREVAGKVQESCHKQIAAVHRLVEHYKSQEQLAQTSLWSQRYDTRLTEKLQHEAQQLEKILHEKNKKLKIAKETLTHLEQCIRKETAECEETEKNLIEERRRFELFLGLRFGKVLPGEVRFFFNHIDPCDPAKEFAFSIRTEGRLHRIIDCEPDPGDCVKSLADKLSCGRLNMAQVVCEMRSVFKKLTANAD